jgi:hypothetical protein
MMKLAFFIAAQGDYLARAVNLCSGDYGYSHVELVFSDGRSFSSHPIGGVKFTNFEPAADAWAFAELPAAEESDEPTIRAWADQCAAEGHAYDFGAIAHFVDPLIPENPNDFMCSEVCITALQSAGWLGDLVPANTSPNDLAQRMGLPKR